MSEDRTHGNPQERPEDGDPSRNALQILRDVKAGAIDPATLSTDGRRQCVGHLLGEGLTVAEVADLLKVSTRTIARDRKAMHEQNAIEPDPELAKIFAGRLAAECEAAAARIRRVTRDRETPPAVRVDGEHRCFEMLDRLAQRLQSMGFLPTAARRIQGDVTHNVGDLASIADLQGELRRLATSEAEPAPALPASSETDDKEESDDHHE